MLTKLGILILLALVVVGSVWAATEPRGLSPAQLSNLPAGEATRGALVFWVGGCDSCHAAKGAQGDERLKLGGGQALQTPFGTFFVPNISTDPVDGIGAWSQADLANALRGVSPEGGHYYPAFPYASYVHMTPQDVGDLWAFLETLPAVAGRAPGHDLHFPWSIRRGVGAWKLAFLRDEPVVEIDAYDPRVARGQYLVEGPGHCGECHTPRGFAGEMDHARWLGGGPAPDGEGKVPNITPGGSVADWSISDLAYYFETGFTPDFDTAGGAMASVQRNLAEITEGDREAIAAYLKAIPAISSR